jgi:hypothetical protein
MAKFGVDALLAAQPAGEIPPDPASRRHYAARAPLRRRSAARD